MAKLTLLQLHQTTYPTHAAYPSIPFKILIRTSINTCNMQKFTLNPLTMPHLSPYAYWKG